MMKVDTYIYRGARPKNFRALHAAGIVTILRLQWGWYDWLDMSPSDEEVTWRSLSPLNDYVNVPLSDFRAPEEQRVRLAVRCLHQHQTARTNIYFHCLHGVDRTGFVAGAYKVVHLGWSIEDAIREWNQMGRHKIYFTWEKAFRQMMEGWHA